MLETLKKPAFKIASIEIKYWMLVLAVIIAAGLYYIPSSSSEDNFEELNKAQEQKNEPAVIPELIVCMAPWCGHTKRFMGLGGANDGEQSYIINGRTYNNRCGGKITSDWEILKSTFENSNVIKIREINFDEPRDQVKTQQEIINLMGDVALEGFPTVYLKVDKKYYKFANNRRADHIVKWINEITGKDYLPSLESFFQSKC
jgi:thiol-disulfide isomerase/thioredoxin